MISIVAFVFLVTFLETQIYYQEKVSNILYRSVLAIMNGIRIFGIKSTLDIFDVLDIDYSNVGMFQTVLANAYIVCYFVAPLLSLKVIVQIVKFLANGRMAIGNFVGNKRIVIVGYNENVESLLDDIIAQKNNKNKKDWLKPVILYKNDIPDDKKTKLYMSGVLLVKYRKFDYEDAKERADILGKIKSKKVKRIIIMEDHDMDSFSCYYFFSKYLEEADCDFESGLKIDCNYNLADVEYLIWERFKDNKEKSVKKYTLNTFSVEMLRAQSILDKCKVYQDSIDRNSNEIKNIHFLIIGFGRMGRRFLKRALNQSVISDNNKITIDIVEKNVDKARDYFKRYCKEYFKDDRVYVGSEVVDGELDIRIHGYDINSVSFEKCMDEICIKEICMKETEKKLISKNPVTYIAICIDNPEESVNCMFRIQDYLRMNKLNPQVVMRMDVEKQIRHAVENMYKKENKKRLHLVSGDDEVLKLNNIRSKNYEEDYKDIHSKDNDKTDKKQWDAFWLESRKYRVLHCEAKRDVVDKLSPEDMALIRNGMELYDVDKSKFNECIRDNEPLKRLGAIEKRRWCYYMILNGWRYGARRDDSAKERPDICPFSDVLEKEELRKNAYFDYKDWDALINKQT